MQESTAAAAAPARTSPSTTTTNKPKVGRPAGRPSGAAAHAATTIAVTPTPEQRDTLAEWARVKGTTPEALVAQAFETMMVGVNACVSEYRRRLAAFDRDTVAEIESGVAR